MIQPNQLVPPAVVRTMRGVSADAIVAAVEAGEFCWVWNVGSGERPERRFWMRELTEEGSTVTKLKLPVVLKMILGERRSRWRGVEIAQLLLISRPQVLRLRLCGALPGKISGHTLIVDRATLEKFLTARWIGQG